jgi:hypothetical protein
MSSRARKFDVAIVDHVAPAEIHDVCSTSSQVKVPVGGDDPVPRSTISSFLVLRTAQKARRYVRDPSRATEPLPNVAVLPTSPVAKASSVFRSAEMSTEATGAKFDPTSRT